VTSTALFLAAALAGPADAVTVIVGATLVDGGGRPPVTDSIVVVRGPVVAAVGDRMRTAIPKGASLVDGRRLWIAPVGADSAAGPALVPAIAAILRGPTARVVAGQPAHLALLDADPRRETPAPAVKRIWIAGQSREVTSGAAR
jgi:hypothetical protein